MTHSKKSNVGEILKETSDLLACLNQFLKQKTKNTDPFNTNPNKFTA